MFRRARGEMRDGGSVKAWAGGWGRALDACSKGSSIGAFLVIWGCAGDGDGDGQVGCNHIQLATNFAKHWAFLVIEE